MNPSREWRRDNAAALGKAPATPLHSPHSAAARHALCLREKAMKFKRDEIEIATPGEQVPAVFMRPAGTGRVPAALLLHGLSSSKERMSDSIGRALADRGVASLAIDLPLHGA